MFWTPSNTWFLHGSLDPPELITGQLVDTLTHGLVKLQTNRLADGAIRKLQSASWRIRDLSDYLSIYTSMWFNISLREVSQLPYSLLLMFFHCIYSFASVLLFVQ